MQVQQTPSHNIGILLPGRTILVVLSLLSISSLNAQVSLSDTDVERITELAATFVPGQISAIEPRDGLYYGYIASDGNVDGFVSLSIQTKTGSTVLIVARISGEWRVPDSEREKLELRKYRQGKKRRELPVEAEPKPSQPHLRER